MSIKKKKVNIQSIWIAGAYNRLSLEDNKEKLESNSIVSQKEIIKQYLDNESDITLYDYYIDDGFTGTNFDRPDFKRLIDDIKQGRINTVIVKDLSRLGRNYIEAGNYLEYFFPLYKIRFISVNDNIDSFKDPSSISNVIVSFKNLMNDEYCRDISKKIRAALLPKKMNGQFISSTVPYGYVKDPNDKYKLIIDDEAANVVKLIFQLTKEGHGISYIAHKLNDDNIPSPSEYKNRNSKVKYGNGSISENNKYSIYWNCSQISRILDNRTYCGDVVQNKSTIVQCKKKKIVRNKVEDFIIVENMHEPIIDRKTFEEIYNNRKKKVQSCEKKYENIYVHHIKCFDCGAAMIRKKTGKRKSNEDIMNFTYYCSTHSNKGLNICSKHKMRSETLDNIVLFIIKFQIELYIDIENSIKSLLEKNIFLTRIEEINIKITKLRNEVNEKRNFKKGLYEDFKKNILSEDEYLSLSNDTDKDIKNINYKINNLLDEKIDLNNNDKTLSCIEKYKKNKNVETLTKEVIDDVIDIIYIHENEDITIKFKYEDEYYKILELIWKYDERNDY